MTPAHAVHVVWDSTCIMLVSIKPLTEAFSFVWGCLQTISDHLYSCRILKQWGLHEVSGIKTLLEYIYMGIVAGMIASGSSFLILQSKWMSSHTLVRQETAKKDSFQQCVINLNAKDATKFTSNYVRFQVHVAVLKLSAGCQIKDWLLKCTYELSWMWPKFRKEHNYIAPFTRWKFTDIHLI